MKSAYGSSEFCTICGHPDNCGDCNHTVTYSITKHRIDLPPQNFTDLCASGLDWTGVVRYLTMVYEVKGGHSLWAWDKDKGEHVGVPWFSVMQYNIVKES